MRGYSLNSPLVGSVGGVRSRMSVLPYEDRDAFCAVVAYNLRSAILLGADPSRDVWHLQPAVQQQKTCRFICVLKRDHHLTLPFGCEGWGRQQISRR